MTDRQKWTEPVEWVMGPEEQEQEFERWRAMMEQQQEPFVCLPVYSHITRMQFRQSESIVLPAAAVEGLLQRIRSLEKRVFLLEENQMWGEIEANL